MSENQALNSIPSNGVSKPSPTRRIPSSPKSNAQMETTLEKQKQILQQYKDTNAALVKYKEKTEQSIAQSKKELDDERSKTSKLVNDITMKNEALLNQKKSENEKKIQEYKDTPLFNSQPIHSMKDSFAEMKTNVEELKNDFSQNFQNFLDDFHSLQSQALSKANEKPKVNEVREKSLDANVAVSSKKLEVSDNSMPYEPATQKPSIKVVERKIVIDEYEDSIYTPHITAFLRKFCAENAKWLA